MFLFFQIITFLLSFLSFSFPLFKSLFLTFLCLQILTFFSFNSFSSFPLQTNFPNLSLLSNHYFFPIIIFFPFLLSSFQITFPFTSFLSSPLNFLPPFSFPYIFFPFPLFLSPIPTSLPKLSLFFLFQSLLFLNHYFHFI